MKGKTAGFIYALAGVSFILLLLAGLSRRSLNGDLKRARRELDGLRMEEAAVRKAQATAASNRDLLSRLENGARGDRPQMYSVLRAVQENVPSRMELYHLSAGVEQGLENGSPAGTLRISGTATGELTAVEARRQLNANARLRSFCGEIRLGSLRRYSGDSWAFALEGNRSAEGARQ